MRRSRRPASTSASCASSAWTKGHFSSGDAVGTPAKTSGCTKEPCAATGRRSYRSSRSGVPAATSCPGSSASGSSRTSRAKGRTAVSSSSSRTEHPEIGLQVPAGRLDPGEELEDRAPPRDRGGVRARQRPSRPRAARVREPRTQAGTTTTASTSWRTRSCPDAWDYVRPRRWRRRGAHVPLSLGLGRARSSPVRARPSSALRASGADNAGVRAALFAVLVAALLVGGRPAEALRHPSAPRCPVFPASNAWNKRVDQSARRPRAPTRSFARSAPTRRCTPTSAPASGRARRSGSRSRSSGQAAEGTSFVRVRRRERPRPLSDPAQRQDRGRTAVRRRPSCPRRRPRQLPPLRAVRALPDGSGGWRAGSGAIWNLRSNRLRPAGWTSADAAGLPILPGLARYDEVAARRDRPRLALHRQPHAARLRLTPPATMRATRPTRPARRWGCACV